MYKFLLNLSILFFFTACTTPNVESKKPLAYTLTSLLQSLDKEIDYKEAEALSTEILRETAKLRKTFDPVAQPHFNNFLINVGVKEKGLCYQWSDALYLHFSKRRYRHFEFHLLVANRGEYFSEHNVLVVSAKGKAVMDGIIIDPWRKPGELYISRVKEDKKYNWEHRIEREVL